MKKWDGNAMQSGGRTDEPDFLFSGLWAGGSEPELF
jgi:hypothetical protein